MAIATATSTIQSSLGPDYCDAEKQAESKMPSIIFSLKTNYTKKIRDAIKLASILFIIFIIKIK